MHDDVDEKYENPHGVPLLEDVRPRYGQEDRVANDEVRNPRNHHVQEEKPENEVGHGQPFARSRRAATPESRNEAPYGSTSLPEMHEDDRENYQSDDRVISGSRMAQILLREKDWRERRGEKPDDQEEVYRPPPARDGVSSGFRFCSNGHRVVPSEMVFDWVLPMSITL